MVRHTELAMKLNSMIDKAYRGHLVGIEDGKKLFEEGDHQQGLDMLIK